MSVIFFHRVAIRRRHFLVSAAMPYLFIIFLGIGMLGLLATTAFNPNGTDGLLAGNPEFFGKELAAVMLSTAWAFVFTFGMLWLIDRVTAVHVSEGVEETGLDAGLHGEQAYLPLG